VPLSLSLVARIVIIALRQRKYRGSEEITVILIYRAGGIAEHAIDAQAVLLEVCQFLGSLSVFTFFDWLWMGADNPRLYFRQLFQKIVESCYEIAFDGKVGQRFNLDGARKIIPQKRGARQLRDAIQHYAAGTTDPHSTRPPVGECAVDVVLQIVQGVEYYPF
jgi:hypothetical protein